MKSILVSLACSIRGSKAAATAAAARSKPKAKKQAPISASVASGSGRSPLEQHLGRDPDRHLLRLVRAQHLRHAELAPDLGAGDAADRLVVDLGQAAGVDPGEVIDQVAGDGEREHAVAEVGEALVGLGPVLGPGRVGQRLAAQVVGELPNQLGERRGTHAGACSSTNATASPTVRIFAACSSETEIP